MEKGIELYNAVVSRRMFLDLRNSCWDNVQKALEKTSSEGGRSVSMKIVDICSTEDDEIVQKVVNWLQDQLPRRGIKVSVGISEVEFSW